MKIEYKKFFGKVWKLMEHVFSRWKILSAYVVFSTLILSGLYIDIIGFFSSQENYATSFRAQHGNLNIYNVQAFLIGTIFYVCLMLYDYLRLRLDKLQGERGYIKNTTLIGDANQSVTQSSQNSPAITSSPGASITYNITGITEERCRAIFDEKWLIAARDFTFESVDTAEERTKEFRTNLLSRIGTEDKGFESFADPAFQFLLMDAQRAAATTERSSDYKVLSELLARRTHVGNDRKLQIHIKKAVEMLPFIPDDALLGLTVNFLLLKIVPVSGNISQGLKALDETFGKTIGNNQLPKGNQWIESLEACGLAKIAIGSLFTMNKTIKIMASHLGGYVLPGIKKDSENYKKAVGLIEGVKLPPTILVGHELDTGYVRICVVEEDKIDNLVIERHLGDKVTMKIQLNEQQKETLHKIYTLYEQDQTLKELFEHKLSEELMKYPYLKMVMEWWDGIDMVYQLNQTGLILANANANKYDENVPIIEE